MKRFILPILAVTAIGFASCKKEYVCDCKKIYTGSSSSATVDDGTYTFKDSRARAEDKCNDEETSGSDLGGSYSRECSIR